MSDDDEILFIVPKNPSPDGTKQRAYITVGEVNRVLYLMDQHSEIVDDLREYAVLSNEINADPNPLVDTSGFPKSWPEIMRITISTTGRDDSSLVAVYVCFEFMRRKSWLKF